MTSTPVGAGEAVSPDELGQRDAWVKQNLAPEQGAAIPFSFTYGGKPSAALLSSWAKKAKDTKLDDRRTGHTLTWTDPESGLVVRCEAVEYRDYPTVEWTLYLKNTGPRETPIVAGLQALDIKLNRKLAEEFVLHHQTGDNCSAHSYEPHEMSLGPKSRQGFAPGGGRPTNGAYPYFNVAYDGGGVIVVIGWPGQWAARFERDDAATLSIAGGQELTHFKLLPGEEVRTPLVVLQFWKGDRLHAQNVWRRWMIAHNLPRPGGKLPPPFTSACMGLHQSESSEIGFIDAYLKGGVKLDYWWMDAGWYPSADWWAGAGTWEPDPQRFPKGIRPVADHAHSKGMKLVLWFEPERAHKGTWLFEKHPEWLLGKGDDRLLDLGNPEGRRWLTDHVDKFLTDQGIDLYRQDHNFDPLPFWRANDAPDRQGITEIRHVEGYLAYWDELRRRHPDMLIDSCASGGRRNDLETLRRAVPLLRSDFQAPQNPGAADMLTGNQGHTYGLSFWVPYYGTGIYYNDVYAVRSHLTPAFGIGYSGDAEKVDWPSFRRRIEDWKQVADCFYGDYYPLTPYSLSEAAWIAWQFNRPESADGMVQAFRRPRSSDESMRLKLHGLDADAVYEVRNLDLDDRTRAAGRTLMEQGLPVKLASRRQAALLAYRRLSTLAAVVSARPETAEVSEMVVLDGKGSRGVQGEIASYSWDLGDGASAEGATVEYTYKAPGTYTVKLVVKDRQGGTDTTSAAITITPVDVTPPAIVAVGSGKKERVVVTFSKPVEQASAERAANYSIDRDVKVLAASLGANLATVTLTTSPLAEGVDYALTVKSIKDRARRPNTIASGARKTFRYSGLFARWGLDEGQGDLAMDSSGNGHHATLSGAQGGPKWAKSARGTVVSFDGVDDFVEADTHFPDLAIPFSISLWVNPAATQMQYADILGNHGEPFVGISIQQDEKTTNSYGFGFGDGKQWQGAGRAQLKADEWQHLAVVCDGEKSVLYLNGVEAGRGPGKGPLAPNPKQNFKLGQGYYSGRYFHGMLSDVRLYDRALSAGEVAVLAKKAGAAAR